MPRALRGVRELGSFGELGGVIEVDFVPSPDEVADAFLRVASYLDNTTKPLIAARRIAMEDMKFHFDTETAPNGAKWASLDPAYLERKLEEGYPSDVLRRSGDLEDSATSERAWVIEGDTLFFNTSVLPTDNEGRPYWFFHETGRQPRFAEAIREFIGEEAKDEMPARPFIGLGEAAISQVGDVFDLWFDEAASVFISPAGILQERLPTGRFGSGVVL